MYTKDKSQRITLRLNSEQFLFVKDTADCLGVSPSDFLRMVINVVMTSSQALDNKSLSDDEIKDIEKSTLATTIQSGLSLKGDDNCRENEIAIQHDFV